MPPKDFVKLEKSDQNKLHKCMKKKFILGNCYLNNLKVLTVVTLTFDPVTPKSIGFLCCPGQMCGQSLREFVGRGVLELLIGNQKVTDGQTVQ